MPDRYRISAHFDLVADSIEALRPVAEQVLTQMREAQQAGGHELAGDSDQLLDNDMAVASLLALFVLARNDNSIPGLHIIDAHVDATRAADSDGTPPASTGSSNGGADGAEDTDPTGADADADGSTTSG